MASTEMENVENQEEGHIEDTNQNVDHFSHFLFGREMSKKEFFIPAQQNKDKNERVDWFLGRSINNQSPENHPFTLNNEDRKLPLSNQFPQNETIEKILNNIDLMELMEQIDSFMTAAKQFKPLFSDFKGIFGKLFK